MIPPVGGLNWTVPPGLISEVEMGRFVFDHSCGRDFERKRRYDSVYCSLQFSDPNYKHSGERVLAVKSQEDMYGLRFFNKYFVTMSRPYGVYSEIMHLLFQPTPNVQNLIDSTMSRLQLQPKQFISAHVRSKFPYKKPRREGLNFSDTATRRLAISWVTNAIHCSRYKAMQIKNQNFSTVFLATDSEQLTKYVLHQNNLSSTVKLVGTELNKVIHSEFPGWNFSDHQPSELYPVFVDLWIMGLSACVSYGKGGFGLLGARLAGEACAIRHRHISGESIPCPS